MSKKSWKLILRYNRHKRDRLEVERSKYWKLQEALGCNVNAKVMCATWIGMSAPCWNINCSLACLCISNEFAQFYNKIKSSFTKYRALHVYTHCRGRVICCCTKVVGYKDETNCSYPFLDGADTTMTRPSPSLENP